MKWLLWLLVPVYIAAPSVNQLYSNIYPAYLNDKPKDSVVDRFGMDNRECVSYIAWKVWDKYHYSTYGWGDAKYWANEARAHGLEVSYTPKIGAVGVSTGGEFGHVFYVEALFGDDEGLISQYNADDTGHYSVSELYASRMFAHPTVQYIYFN